MKFYHFNYIWISVDKIVATVDIISEKLDLNPVSTRTGFHWPPFNTVDHLHLHVISPIEKMNVMKNMMFKPSSYWFVSVSMKIYHIQTHNKYYKKNYYYIAILFYRLTMSNLVWEIVNYKYGVWIYNYSFVLSSFMAMTWKFYTIYNWSISRNCRYKNNYYKVCQKL